MVPRLSLWVLALALWSASPAPAAAQAAQATGTELAASGYFRDSDTLPGSYRLYLQEPKTLDWLWGAGPLQQEVRRSSFAADAHAGVADYSPRRLCTDCHTDHTRDLHVARMGVACVQCHRGSPIAGIHHYYSAMNPIRRHAYVCAKCHEGASPSFASYVVHEPDPLAGPTRGGFPALFYATWLMAIIAGGVFLVFIPYVVLWGGREVIEKMRGEKRHVG
jgi:hypothetical protein